MGGAGKVSWRGEGRKDGERGRRQKVGRRERNMFLDHAIL